jgi:hypothetical protein
MMTNAMLALAAVALALGACTPKPAPQQAQQPVGQTSLYGDRGAGPQQSAQQAGPPRPSWGGPTDYRANMSNDARRAEDSMPGPSGR